MIAEYTPDPFDRFANGLIKRKLRSLRLQSVFEKEDPQDLYQQLRLKLLQAWPKYDPSRGHRNTFVTTVVERYVATLVRDRYAAKRRDWETCSYDDPLEIGEEDSGQLLDGISEERLRLRLARRTRSDAELAELRMDVEEILQGLPSDLRDVAERLKYGTVSQVARETGIPRSTLYGHVRRLRRRFEAAGLKNLIEKKPPVRVRTG